MTESMIANVAKAICRDRAEPWEALNEQEQQSWRETAIAAVRALREPGLEVRKLTTFEFAELEWPKLIDSILSDTEERG